MISFINDASSSLLLILLTIVCHSASFTSVVAQDDEGFEQLRQRVAAFYSFRTEPSLSAAPQTPCSTTQADQVAVPQWSVFTSDPSDPHHATCPWEMTFDEDVTGTRYPCRISTARLLPRDRSPFRPQPCLRNRRQRYGRRHGRLCEPLLQSVPVLERVMQSWGHTRFEILNTTITVGFTCAFERF